MGDNLLEKTVLVTGGAGGLGKAIATKFLEAGANVVICDIHEQRLREAAAELGVKGRVKAVQADITSATDVQRLVDEVVAEFRQLDVLINNAGIMDRFDPVGDLDEGLWDRVMAVNLTAPYLLSKLAVRNMLAQGEGKRDGCIVNIVSVAAKAGWAAGAAYTASKHGLVGLTKNTASFYGNQGIRCNALMLGGMDTNIVDAFQSGINAVGLNKARGIMAAVQAPLCQADQAADVCLSLACGKGSKLINGACIPVDQGWTGVVG
ncbi:putative short chain dehydrogenase/oxidoreductase [Aspergillus steynii IBT 23096]|uniref:Putative short chain dehydrogenase/oxidoreductase n=1 Tax=Aspergillus steynii IBT 23096 TaxID=1392250 RepID=A0A2I2GLQ0_9EURO|nr:putative short chain dehydrogenase/oxidoreductase [Aspergillus steynii IBT 23096]PLB53797.1 putative short chain dehydrogenase/oxidoreductase [Aspergillus steynii IBT 23096]